MNLCSDDRNFYRQSFEKNQRHFKGNQENNYKAIKLSAVVSRAQNKDPSL